jgi:hypothetical protein
MSTDEMQESQPEVQEQNSASPVEEKLESPTLEKPVKAARKPSAPKKAKTPEELAAEQAEHKAALRAIFDEFLADSTKKGKGKRKAEEPAPVEKAKKAKKDEKPAKPAKEPKAKTVKAQKSGPIKAVKFAAGTKKAAAKPVPKGKSTATKALAKAPKAKAPPKIPAKAPPKANTAPVQKSESKPTHVQTKPMDMRLSSIYSQLIAR